MESLLFTYIGSVQLQSKTRFLKIYLKQKDKYSSHHGHSTQGEMGN